MKMAHRQPRAGASRLTVVLLSRRCCVKAFLSPPLGLRFWTPAWFRTMSRTSASASLLEHLLEDEVWLRIEAAIRQNNFSALAAFPPSPSFTSTFRLASGVGVHGRRELRSQEKWFVRKGTRLALRCLHAAHIFHKLGLYFPFRPAPARGSDPKKRIVRSTLHNFCQDCPRFRPEKKKSAIHSPQFLSARPGTCPRFRPEKKVRSTLHNFCLLGLAPARDSDPKKRKVQSTLHNFCQLGLAPAQGSGPKKKCHPRPPASWGCFFRLAPRQTRKRKWPATTSLQS